MDFFFCLLKSFKIPIVHLDLSGKQTIFLNVNKKDKSWAENSNEVNGEHFNKNMLPCRKFNAKISFSSDLRNTKEKLDQ